MKIGILSLPPFMNYGGILQTYALQCALNKMGHDVVVLDRRNKANLSLRSILIQCKKILCHYVLKQPIYSYDERKHEFYNSCYDVFIKFINNDIRITKPIYSSEELIDAINIYDIDAIVVGSDQVWRPSCAPCIEDYFVSFLQDNVNVLAIAYAASFGTNQWEYSQAQELKLSKYIRRFNAVSVREKDAVELCIKHFNLSVSMAVDPTMLHDKEFYFSLCLDLEDKISPSQVVSYVLDISENKQRIINKLSDFWGNDMFSIPIQADEGEFISVPEWLYRFYRARYIITDSFHGCVFSIIFNVPFVALNNNIRGQSRIQSLLDSLSLSDRQCDNLDQLEQIINKDINWQSVNTKLAVLKSNSWAFLKEYLNETNNQ